MKIDLNSLKTTILNSKQNDRLLIHVNAIEKDDGKIYSEKINKFVKKGNDYVIVVIKK